MSLLPSGGRFASADCYALLSCDAAVIDLSYGMRNLYRRFSPRGEMPATFKSLIAERDHPVLLAHLDEVCTGGESRQLELQLVHEGRTPLSARIFSVPAERENVVQSFLAISGSASDGNEPLPASGHHRRSLEDHVGFMVLKPGGDFSRPVISFCDAQLRRILGAGDAPLADRSIYQVFPREASRRVLNAICDARVSGAPRRFVFSTSNTPVLRGVVFVTSRSAMLLVENCSARNVAGSFGTDSPGGFPAAAPDVERFLRLELRPGLRALRNLAKRIGHLEPAEHSEHQEVKVLEELASQLYQAVENTLQPSAGEGTEAPFEEDVMGRLVEGVRDIAHPALANRARSVSIVDEVPPQARIFSTYSLHSLQQVLVDLLGEAAEAIARPELECRIRPRDESAGHMILEFAVEARGECRMDLFAGGGTGMTERLSRRPMFKACRRFLRALGAELEVETEEPGSCRYRFALAFGKLSALQTT